MRAVKVRPPLLAGQSCLIARLTHQAQPLRDHDVDSAGPQRGCCSTGQRSGQAHSSPRDGRGHRGHRHQHHPAFGENGSHRDDRDGQAITQHTDGNQGLALLGSDQQTTQTPLVHTAGDDHQWRGRCDLDDNRRLGPQCAPAGCAGAQPGSPAARSTLRAKNQLAGGVSQSYPPLSSVSRPVRRSDHCPQAQPG